MFSSIVWSDKWTKSLFSNYGISGLGNLEITPELAAKVGAAFGSTLPKGASVNCSRSSHKICRIINRALICGLTSAGVNVADLRVMPSPVARFKPTAFRRAGGLHVGLSGSDPNQVEIRIFDAEGRELAPTNQKSIERLFNREDFRRVSMHDVGDIVFPPRVSEYYSNELLNNIDVDVVKKRALKIVVDFAYSGASGIFSAFLGKLGCEVIALNAFQDEEKIQKASSNIKAAMVNVSSIVRSLNADVGLLLDSEAEQITIIDDKGRPMLGELALQAWVKLIFDLTPN
ncbi:MAG TPA: nucleotidyltransferase, partial [Candidatus Ozemobacteraceae bacterium]|nr:nucleotidyltransferase [Candidatus Ozemobacteraceae bacterium]